MARRAYTLAVLLVVLMGCAAPAAKPKTYKECVNQSFLKGAYGTMVQQASSAFDWMQADNRPAFCTAKWVTLYELRTSVASCSPAADDTEIMRQTDTAATWWGKFVDEAQLACGSLSPDLNSYAITEALGAAARYAVDVSKMVSPEQQASASAGQ